jgi:hypothetical protein
MPTYAIERLFKIAQYRNFSLPVSGSINVAESPFALTIAGARNEEDSSPAIIHRFAAGTTGYSL